MAGVVRRTSKKRRVDGAVQLGGEEDRAAGDPEKRPPDAACRFVLATLVSLGPLRSASLWSIDSTERATCVCHVGAGRPSRGAQQLARKLIAGEEPELDGRRLLVALPVGYREPPGAAVWPVGTSRPRRESTRCRLVAETR